MNTALAKGSCSDSLSQDWGPKTMCLTISFLPQTLMALESSFAPVARLCDFQKSLDLSVPLISKKEPPAFLGIIQK